MIDFYHATLKQSPEALAYLQARGLDHPEADRHVPARAMRIARWAIGCRTSRSKAGAELRGALQRMGILRETGHEHFNGSLVVPVIDRGWPRDREVYGRKIWRRSKLRAGTPLHLYLPGPHRGVFNEAGLVGQEEVILCEALIDALTFWCAGYRNVTASYGIEGFTDEHPRGVHAARREAGADRV